jgi:magnesium-transporting ATPase (P-type)
MRWQLIYEYLFGGRAAPRRSGTGLLPADVFTFIQSVVQDPFARIMDAMLIALNAQAAGVVHILMIIVLAIVCIAFAIGRPVENPLWTLIKMAGPWWLTVNIAAFYEWVVVFGIYVLPTALVNAVAGTLGGGRSRLDAEAFGGVLNDAMLMGADLFRAAGINPVYFLIVLALVLSAGVAIAYSWWVWFKAGIFLIALFAISPIPVLCVITPWTRGLFFRWIDCVQGFIWLKILSVVFIALLLSVMSQIAGIVIGDTSSIVGKIGLIICATLVFIAMTFASLDVPRLASALSGGTVMHSGYGALAFGAGWASRGWRNYRRNQDRIRQQREDAQPAPA